MRCLPLLALIPGLAAPPVAAAGPAPASKALLKRGAYLVGIMGCHDCHTPLKMGPKGPEPDMSRMLSGHPEGMKMPPPPALPPGPWGWAGSLTMTAFTGPWGVSYSANLTPDRATGLGDVGEQDFIQAMRTGRHLGKGRPILPPMPFQGIGTATDADLKAIFAYFRSIPAIRNKVPEPVDPADAPKP